MSYQPLGVSAHQVRCDRKPGDPPYTGAYDALTIAYVQRGSFRYGARGKTFEMVQGAAVIGQPETSYICTHEDSLGDDCLLFRFPNGALELLDAGTVLRNTDALPPIAEVAVWGELAHAVMDGRSDLALDELGWLLAAAAVRAVHRAAPRRDAVVARQRARIIEASYWINAHSNENISLEQAARSVSLSPYHFLRQFVRVLGVTPHQYLLRSRLRRAAHLLSSGELSITEVAASVGFADLSNFVRSFGRAAGMSPREFRRAARGDRPALICS